MKYFKGSWKDFSFDLNVTFLLNRKLLIVPTKKEILLLLDALKLKYNSNKLYTIKSRTVDSNPTIE